LKLSRTSKRRLSFSIALVLLVSGYFVVRLVDIQVVRAGELNQLSLDKRALEVTTYGQRGSIVDSNGVVLASSVERYNITASPRLVKPFTRTVDGVKASVTVAEALTELAAVTGKDPAVLLNAVSVDPTSDFAYLSKAVDLAVLTAVRALRIPWVWDETQPGRTYPNGAVAGNLLGFIGTDGPQAGLELTENDCLAATNGTSVYERGSDGVRIPGSTVTTEEAADGSTLKLTIDSDLQWYIQQVVAARAKELGADWATAVVVDVKNGQLKAVVDYPSVDPNNVDGSSVNSLGSLAFSTPFEPGSTMKALTVASLLDEGLISPATQLTVPGRIQLADDNYIRDAWSHGDIRFTAAGVLVNSSNTGISILSDLMRPKDSREYMLKFGLNSETAVGFNGESSGSVPETQNWDQVTNYTIHFGQGLSLTAVQVAGIYQTLGNGGLRMPLTLVQGCTHADGSETELPSPAGVRAVSAAAANTTIQILENVASTGPLSNLLSIPGYRVAAKSGTAEVAENGKYGNQRIISIAGVVPAESPEYAVVVTFGRPDTMKTSTAAAPTFRTILTQVIKTFRITPSTQPAPFIPLEW
jgi:cell division protein FtsI (penicillin-binding protein 3)